MENFNKTDTHAQTISILDTVKPEELLPLVARLTDRYTSMDSSSVTYETAQMLMEAVLYTLEHGMQSSLPKDTFQTVELLSSSSSVALQDLYEHGQDIIRQKALAAKQLYEQLSLSFDDYGCRNYSDTIRKGLPEFFRRYDARFQPQNTILTLDYPTMISSPHLCGVDRIYDYLQKIALENEFLSRFRREAVIDLLRRGCPEYEELYLDNICEPVLYAAVCCLMVRKPTAKLYLDSCDEKELRAAFASLSREEADDTVCKAVKHLLAAMKLPEAEEYFLQNCKNLSARLNI